jgi:transposase
MFQLHGANAAEAGVLRKKLRRKEMMWSFEKLPPTTIAIEVCGATHDWARLPQLLGHSVKLILPQLLKPYTKRGKNDTADDALRAGEDCRTTSDVDAGRRA